MAGLIPIPRATMHHASLANIGRIIKHNMLDAAIGVPQTVVDDIPTLVPYHKAVTLFFVKVAAALTAVGATSVPYKGSVQYHRNDINSALEIIRWNMWTMAGAPLPNSPPVLVTPIPDQSYANGESVNWDTSQYWAGAPTNFTITMLTGGLSMSPTGVVSGITVGSASMNPIITATNANGSTESNVFNIAISGTLATSLNKNDAPPKSKKKSKRKSK